MQMRWSICGSWPENNIIRAIRDIPSPVPQVESHTCFVSMTPDLAGGFHAAYREFSPCTPGIFRSDIFNAHVRYQHYTTDLELDGPSRLLRERLEDPRAFTWRGVPYCVALDETSFGFAIYNNVVINLLTGECHNLTSDLEYDGKNWMPLPDGDELYFIRSVDPWCLLKVDASWHCKTVGIPSIIDPQAISPYQTKYPATIHPRQIGRYRGGAAAYFDPARTIRGIGHETIALEHHQPFLFEMAHGVIRTTELDPVGFDGFGIIDPTTILPGGRILCAYSDRVWNHPQLTIRMKLCEVK